MCDMYVYINICGVCVGTRVDIWFAIFFKENNGNPPKKKPLYFETETCRIYWRHTQTPRVYRTNLSFVSCIYPYEIIIIKRVWCENWGCWTNGVSLIEVKWRCLNFFFFLRYSERDWRFKSETNEWGSLSWR